MRFLEVVSRCHLRHPSQQWSHPIFDDPVHGQLYLLGMTSMHSEIERNVVRAQSVDISVGKRLLQLVPHVRYLRRPSSNFSLEVMVNQN